MRPDAVIRRIITWSIFDESHISRYNTVACHRYLSADQLGLMILLSFESRPQALKLKFFPQNGIQRFICTRSKRHPHASIQLYKKQEMGNPTNILSHINPNSFKLFCPSLGTLGVSVIILKKQDHSESRNAVHFVGFGEEALGAEVDSCLLC